MTQTRAIAFYLPQFHPIPENDRWWGKGFTEWSNVSRARPLFPGHEQPQLPRELGFYDLRVPEVRRDQAELARRFGIHGFCYYYYWFNGRRLLERPLDEVLRSGEPDFPFCICWANENWTRRWDGAEQEILMKQEHSPISDEAFMRDVLPLFADPRYIRVDGAPLLLVYRAGIMPTPLETTELWRRTAASAGFPKIHLSAVHSFGLGDPRSLGFDSGVEFPPHGIAASEITAQVEGLDEGFTGRVYDYREVVRHALESRPVDWLRFRGVMTAWDNTARRGLAGHVFHHASPREYEIWLRAAVAEAQGRPKEHQLIFINAWNEWAEGAHLEPDQRHGMAYLEATARALRGRTEWHDIVRLIRQEKDLSPEVLRNLVTDLEFALEGRERSLAHFRGMQAVIDRMTADAELAIFSGLPPAGLSPRGLDGSGRTHIDKIQGAPVHGVLRFPRTVNTSIEGWAFAPGIPSNGATQSWLVLRSRRDRVQSWFAPLRQRHAREDVVKHFSDVDRRFTERAGFKALLSCEEVPPGDYELGVLHLTEKKAIAGFTSQPVQLQ